MKKLPTIREIATAAGRNYITPEDIDAAIKGGLSKAKLQQEVLEVLGNTSGFGCEDGKLCAFVAAEYERKAKQRRKP